MSNWTNMWGTYCGICQVYHAAGQHMAMAALSPQEKPQEATKDPMPSARQQLQEILEEGITDDNLEPYIEAIVDIFLSSLPEKKEVKGSYDYKHNEIIEAIEDKWSG